MLVRLTATWTVERTSSARAETVVKDRLVNLDDVRQVSADHEGRAVIHWRTPGCVPMTCVGSFDDLVEFVYEIQGLGHSARLTTERTTP